MTDAYGTITGGDNNQAGDNAGSVLDRPFATVGGGSNNTASGYVSTVAGGFGNTASGDFSFAAGVQANATHPSSFIWNGWYGGSAPSFASNRAHFFGENGLSVDFRARRSDGGGTF
ncbi:MAG: hypothetical protein HOP18_07410 [Deltaproteobacteria bacterium]|nr:hypothetical protein [Deltaproteobacteria bacterium]